MSRCRFMLYVSGLPLLLATSIAGADEWPGPRIKEVFSESREYFVRIIPGESLGDTFGFAGAKKGRYARAEFYRRAQDRSYRLVAEAGLPNPVAPVDFFVADNGHTATVDNWHNVGYGKVVSIYDARGNLIQSYELRDLFQSEEIESFPRSSSSIRWREGPAYIRADQKTLLITVKSGADFVFGLETGQFKYCEYQDNVYRCRNANQPRQWMPNSKVQLTR
jgi:hypothetical protein